MHSNRIAHRAALAAALVVIAALAFTAGASAKSYKFKADITIKQSVSWTSGWKSSVVCGSDYRHVYKGDGSGGFTLKGKSIPVSFKVAGSGASSSTFGIPNQSVRRNSKYAVSAEGDPGDNCQSPAPTPVDVSKCGSMSYKTREKAFALVVVRGRLAPLGSIDDRYDAKCPDETSWSVVTKGGASKQRKDVHKLIKNPRVRSIELSASRAASTDVTEPDITAGDLSLPGDQKTITGAGFASYKWSVKLTRVH